MSADGLQDRWRQSWAFSEVGVESMGECIVYDLALPRSAHCSLVAPPIRFTVSTDLEGMAAMGGRIRPAPYCTGCRRLPAFPFPLRYRLSRLLRDLLKPFAQFFLHHKQCASSRGI
jgi:hypothetical protein